MLSSISRRWALFVFLLVIALVVILAVPVGAPATIGDHLPSCGSPLTQGITLSAPPSGGSFTSTDANSWMSSPWCAATRSQRAVEATTLALLVLLTTGVVAWAIRRRRWILDASEPPTIRAGIIAVVLGDALGILIGLAVARSLGTRRMLWTQLGTVAGHLVFLAVALLGIWLSRHVSGEGNSWLMLGASFVGSAALGLLTLLYPLALRRRPG